MIFAVNFLIAQECAKHTSNGNKEVRITGEIIDIKCYVTGMMGGRGEEHKQCAIDCIKGGLPVGVIDEKGIIYTVVPSKGMRSANEKLGDLAAEKLTFTGKVKEKDGIRLLMYNNMETTK